MNTRTPNCLMVLRPSASSTSVSLVVGSAGGMRRSSWSAAHRGSSCSMHLFLLVACNMVGRTLVSDGRGGQSDHSGKTALTLDALTKKKKTVRHLHLHPHSIMFTNSSESFYCCVLCSFFGLPVSSDFQGRRNFGMASVLHAGTSGAHERFQQCSHLSSEKLSHNTGPNHPCVAEPHMEVSGARGASSCHVACAMVGLDLVDDGWTGGSDHDGKNNSHFERAHIKCI